MSRESLVLDIKVRIVWHATQTTKVSLGENVQRPFIQWTTPIRFERLTHVMRVRGVDVYLHWTVFAVIAFFLVGALQSPLLTLLGPLSYLSMIWIHEVGHAIVAHSRGSEVFEVVIYPIAGITRFQTPWSRFDHCLIAWGGVVAQLLVAVPIVLWITFFGFTLFQSVNAVLAILGYVSLGIAAFNLLPVPGLDGATAWGLFPALLSRDRSTRANQFRGWRS